MAVDGASRRGSTQLEKPASGSPEPPAGAAGRGGAQGRDRRDTAAAAGSIPGRQCGGN